jgi:4-alpha-glucanotransferase
VKEFKMRFQRAGGVLLHPTSLPSRFGIGDLGEGAYQFINFLAKSGQSVWQVLPLGPTGYADSPYQSFSAFAGNPLLISPDILVQDGYLPASAVANVPDFPDKKVDYGWVISYKEGLLSEAYRHFKSAGDERKHAAFEKFCESSASWLEDYALFKAIKNYQFNIGANVWTQWPKPIALRNPKALKGWGNLLSKEVDLQKFQQFLFFEQWLALKKAANERGIRLFGDVPIFVAFDSADVWANPDLFYLDEQGEPTVIAGVPPDYFSETGQRWGNPLYRWEKMANNDYTWWADRLRMAFTQVDIVRIDHFRGFEAYWEIPAEEETAVVGKWVKGPETAFFDAMRRHLGDLPIVAEDLGVITPEVVALRKRYDFPGMKILQFAFGGERNSLFLPHNFGRNSVVYTGTHDNETTLGWYQNADPFEKDHIRRYIARDATDISWDMIRLAYASVADTAVVPLQDLMSLGNEARMNYPGKKSGWWQWRYTEEMLTEEITNRLYELTELYGRLPSDDIES